MLRGQFLKDKRRRVEKIEGEVGRFHYDTATPFHVPPMPNQILFAEDITMMTRRPIRRRLRSRKAGYSPRHRFEDRSIRSVRWRTARLRRI